MKDNTGPYFVLAQVDTGTFISEKENFKDACNVYRSLQSIYGDNIIIAKAVIKYGEKV